MKRLRNLLTVVMILAMILTLSVTALAASYTITVTNTNSSISIDGQTYNAYKLFDLQYDVGGTAFSYTISTSNYFYTTAGAKAVLDGFFTFTASASDPNLMIVQPLTTGTYYDAGTKTISDVGARKLADDLQQYISGATATASAAAVGETATIDVGVPGYFIVTGSAKPNDTVGTETAVSAVILTNTKPTANVNPKVDIPTLSKAITGVTEATSGGTQSVAGAVLDANGQAAVAKVGSTVSFKLESAIPDLRGYTDYTFTITDTLSSGLTYANNFVLKINNTVVSIAPSVSGQTWTLTIPYATLNTYAKGQTIEITYDATVNNGALTTNYESNTAKLTYSYDPYNVANTNDTPNKTVYVVDINVDVDKVNGTANKLAGAEFKLYRETSTPGTYEYYKWDTANNKVSWVENVNDADTFTTGATGAFTQSVRGLDAGTYYLLETVAPTGYNLPAAAIEVNITATETAGIVTYTSTTGAAITNGTVNLGTGTSDQPLATVTVENQSGTELPSTGGIGTTIFYIIGGVLVVGAGVLLITKKRMKADED